MLVRAVRQGQVTPPSSGLSINICTGLGNACVSTITRYVWAGDQVLWELRAPGADGQNLESVGDGTYPSSQAYLFGQVSYLHAGGIDRPLTIWKRNVGAVRPHQNWRGLFFRGTWGTSSVPDTPPVGSAANCVTVNVNECLAINWPGDRTTAWHESRGGESALWMGGLVDGMRDPTGQIYMRNRYYNPQTGQFTQMDPIGLAGGLNAYGFAAGDPVTYSDPYGLCPPQDLDMSFRCLWKLVKNALEPNPLIPIGDVQVPGRVAWDPRNFRDIVGAIGDFVENYDNMRDANTMGADEYFHAKANCEAAQRGAAGVAVSIIISDGREVADRAKGDPSEASAADQVANRTGRDRGAAQPTADCRELVSDFRPNGLDPKY